MPPPGDKLSSWLDKRPRARVLLVGLMLATFAVCALIAARTNTPTDDEFVQLPMGLYYLKTGRFDLDRRNPPLIKMLSAAPLLLTGAKLDTDPKWRAQGEGWWMWIFGTRFMRINQDNYFDLFFAGRIPNILLGMAGALLVYAWARSLFGSAPATGTLLLYSTTPVLIGHASVATLDMGVTVFLLAGFLSLRRLATDRHWKWAFLSGALFGCALASKYVTLILIPLVPLLLAMEWRPRGPENWLRLLKALAFMALAGWFAINAAYLFKGFPLPDEMTDGIVFKSLEPGEGKSLSFLLGLWSTKGWWYYYAVALFYKSTIPLLLLLGVAVCGAIMAWEKRPKKSLIPWLAPALWITLPPLTLIYALSFHYQINFGIRYILPAIPFLLLIAGYGIQMLLRGTRPERVALGVLLGWQVLACALSTPKQLAYFNEVAGGPYLARNILLDSNLDWGQDLGRLKQYMSDHEIDRIGLGYFGCVDPKLYGINYSIAPFEPHPGLYAISANYLSGLPPAITYLEEKSVFSPPGHWNWFDDFQPIARVGSSIYIFKIEDADLKNHRAMSSTDIYH